jgi:hypothetical protein
MANISFDIFLHGLKDPSAGARQSFQQTMERLTGQPAANFEQALSRLGEPLFSAIERERALEVIAALEQVGARVEIRPNTSPPKTAEPESLDLAAPAEPESLELAEEVATRECPSCGFASPVNLGDCPKCGLVFAKWERESIQRMQREKRLEEAITKALQVREEWVQRAQTHLSKHPLPEGATEPFAKDLLSDEVPFLRLISDEGPLLLTSRRLLSRRKDHLTSIPFEIISDVDVGGGLVTKPGRAKLQLTFQTPIPQPSGAVKTLTWQLHKESAHFKDVILDWAFARGFLCGSCGAKEAEWRFEGGKIRFRCMRCATDHEVDLIQAVAIPDIQE